MTDFSANKASFASKAESEMQDRIKTLEEENKKLTEENEALKKDVETAKSKLDVPGNAGKEPKPPVPGSEGT